MIFQIPYWYWKWAEPCEDPGHGSLSVSPHFLFVRKFPASMTFPEFQRAYSNSCYSGKEGDAQTRKVQPRNSPGQNTGLGSLSLLQRIFATQGLNPGLPHCRWFLYQLSHKGSPFAIKLFTKSFWVGSHDFWGVSLLCPTLPGKAVKLFFSPTPQTLSLRLFSTSAQRGQVFGSNTRYFMKLSWLNHHWLLSNLSPTYRERTSRKPSDCLTTVYK